MSFHGPMHFPNRKIWCHCNQIIASLSKMVLPWRTHTPENWCHWSKCLLMCQLHVCAGPYQHRRLKEGAPKGGVTGPTHHHLPSLRQRIRNMPLDLCVYMLYVCICAWVRGLCPGLCHLQFILQVTEAGGKGLGMRPWCVCFLLPKNFINSTEGGSSDTLLLMKLLLLDDHYIDILCTRTNERLIIHWGRFSLYNNSYFS